MPRLTVTEELRILHGKGGFAAWLATLARTEVLVLDDWALAPLEPATRADIMEIVDDRAGTRGRATILTTQLPVDHWHAWLRDPTLADAILDRLLEVGGHDHRNTQVLRQGRRQRHPLSCLRPCSGCSGARPRSWWPAPGKTC